MALICGHQFVPVSWATVLPQLREGQQLPYTELKPKLCPRTGLQIWPSSPWFFRGCLAVVSEASRLRARCVWLTDREVNPTSLTPRIRRRSPSCEASRDGQLPVLVAVRFVLLGGSPGGGSCCSHAGGHLDILEAVAFALAFVCAFVFGFVLPFLSCLEESCLEESVSAFP